MLSASQFPLALEMWPMGRHKWLSGIFFPVFLPGGCAGGVGCGRHCHHLRHPRSGQALKLAPTRVEGPGVDPYGQLGDFVGFPPRPLCRGRGREAGFQGNPAFEVFPLRGILFEDHRSLRSDGKDNRGKGIPAIVNTGGDSPGIAGQTPAHRGFSPGWGGREHRGAVSMRR